MLELHFQSGVGHVGGNLSCLDALMVLFHRVMRPEDRFVLSKGHAAGALYVTLWSLGRLEEPLESFHRDATLLAGHPPAKGLKEVLFASGSLGHGLPFAAGLALAARLKKETRRVFCLTSDGEWQSGPNWEALIFAAHRRLGHLTVLVDANRLQAFGATAEVASLDPLGPKFQGFGVETIEVDGHDPEAVEAALVKPEGGQVRAVLLNTVKGKGVRAFENQVASHYLPLDQETFQTAMDDLTSW